MYSVVFGWVLSTWPDSIWQNYIGKLRILTFLILHDCNSSTYSQLWQNCKTILTTYSMYKNIIIYALFLTYRAEKQGSAFGWYCGIKDMHLFRALISPDMFRINCMCQSISCLYVRSCQNAHIRKEPNTAVNLSKNNLNINNK